MFGKKKFSDIRISYSKFIIKISSFKPQLWVLNSKWRDLDLRLEGYGTCGINGLFFKGDLKDFTSEDWFDPQPDSVIQPKARGLLHMERDFITHHIKEDLRLEHLIASMQQRKHSEDYSKHSTKCRRIPEALEALGDVFRSTQRLQDSTTKRSRPCQTQGSRTTHRHRIFYSKG